MKVAVNLDLCEGYGACADVAPSVLLLDEWGYAYVENDGLVPADQEAAARRAVHECPMSAITVAE